jgi:hypothetical protein
MQTAGDCACVGLEKTSSGEADEDSLRKYPSAAFAGGLIAAKAKQPIDDSDPFPRVHTAIISFIVMVDRSPSQ